MCLVRSLACIGTSKGETIAKEEPTGPVGGEYSTTVYSASRSKAREHRDSEVTPY
jgi:hypothetical protein